MTTSAVIGSLRVVLGADSAALEKGLGEARSSLEKFSAGFAKIGAIAAAGFAAVGAGAAVAIRGALVEADKLGKMSQSIGVPVEELSKLKYAAELSDVSIETLGKSMTRLARNMADTARGAGGDAAQAFTALGVSVKNSDGSMKASSAVLGEIANKFSKYEDGANKTALALAIFGREGAGMIPMLNEGRAALEAAGKEAAKFGLVLTKDVTDRAQVFNDNMTKLGAVTKGFSIQIAAGLSKDLAALSEALVNVAKDTDFVKAATNVVSFSMRAFGAVTVAATAWLKDWAQTFAAVGDAIRSVMSLKFAEAWERLGRSLEESKTINANAEAAIRRLWAGAEGAAGATDKLTGAIKGQAPALTAGAAAMDQYFASVNKKMSGMRAEMETIGLSEAAQARLKLQYEAVNTALEKGVTLTPELQARIVSLSDSYGALTQRLADARQNWQFVEGGINTVASGLTDIAMRTKTAGEAFRDMAVSIIRDFAQMTIKAQLFKLATAFMGGGFGGSPLNITGVGAHVPGGFSAAFPMPAFAQGGSFAVPGSGGIDSQFVSFMATPGERVSVTKDGGYPGGGGELRVHVIPHDDKFAAYVEDGAGRVVARSAQQIAGAAVKQSIAAMPGALSDMRRRGQMR